MRVAVTGATGFIGRELCAALLRDGHTVVALTRDPRRAQAALPGALVANWGDPAAALPPVDGVVNLAGESVAGRWSEDKKRRLRESRIAGTRRLVETIARAPERPTVLVSASAVGYYGDRGEETLTEASGPGRDFLAQLCQEWEAEAQRASELGLRVARLRLGVVLDRDGGALSQMLILFRLGAGGPLGSGRQWFRWVHRADVVGLFRFALETAEASGPINAVAPHLLRNSEFARAVGDQPPDLGAVRRDSIRSFTPPRMIERHFGYSDTANPPASTARRNSASSSARPKPGASGTETQPSWREYPEASRPGVVAS